MKNFLSLIVVTIFVLAGCKDAGTIEPAGNEGTALNKTYDVPAVVKAELQAVKQATARYNDIKQAEADGYEDINVYYPQMGYHWLKATVMDTTFELTKPEILVYQIHENGRHELVAVEYGTPLTQPAPPEGFTGDLDVWSANTEAGIWALHAWIWKYNPEGVFNPDNPLLP